MFNPHDLQHVHLPEYFAQQEIERREALYRQACQLATAVATTSRQVKDDVVRQYQLPPEKVEVIWWGSPAQAYPRPSSRQVEKVLERHNLSPGFAIYPAQTWPHKNHLGLLEALHLLRQRGLRVNLVCTGRPTDHYSAIEQRLAKLKLGDQVRFLGQIPELELMALYQAAKLMVVPTLFEAGSFPVFEAFSEKLAVCCSRVTSLPEQVGDAGLLFDPHDPNDMAKALGSLYEEEELRQELVRRGSRQLGKFSWQQTAQQYRQLYHRVAGGSSTKNYVAADQAT